MLYFFLNSQKSPFFRRALVVPLKFKKCSLGIFYKNLETTEMKTFYRTRLASPRM